MNAEEIVVKQVVRSLNPLGIGEGFELDIYSIFKDKLCCLNPLGIGEGFEL